MPKKLKSVRNFWLEGEIEGRKNPVKVGPKSKDGGFTLSIKQRSNGEIKEVSTITGKVSQCGDSLALLVKVGDDTHTYWTPR